MRGLSSLEVAGPWLGVGFALMAMACGGRGLQPATRTAVLGLRSSAVVPQPEATLSCHGDVFCRENVIRTANAEAVEEVTDDCTQRGGMTSSRPCSRERMVASCLVASGELGPITVFAYGQADEEREREAVATMSKLCEQFDGTFELAKR